MQTLSPVIGSRFVLWRFKNNYLAVFTIALLVSFAIFLPFMILDRGYFFYYGDFNVQQLPFYVHAHEAVKSGQIFWDWQTDLGANFIGSYSFYLLTSPFFWLTLPFPSEFVPHLMAPLLILKFACAATTAFAFAKRFLHREDFAVLVGLLYAFCGFNQYNIFFNHFHEAVIVFPLLLVALEEAVMNRRRGVFALTVALAAAINYFFFIGQVTFVFIYFLLRCLCPEFRIDLKALLSVTVEAVLGVLLACVILLPSVLAISGNYRTETMLYGMDLLLYSNEQRYGHILSSLFFPPDIPSRPNFFPESGAKWASISLYLPLFSLTGVVVFFRAVKKHWIKTLLLVSLVMMLIPTLNSTFFAFNSSYYARWFYMPILIMALATGLVLEKKEINFTLGIKFCAVAVAVFSAVGLLPTKDDNGVVSWFSFPPYPERIWMYVVISVVSLILLWRLFKTPRDSKRFFQKALLFTCLMSFVSTVLIVSLGKSHATSEVYRKVVEQGVHGKEKLSLDDESFFRIDVKDIEDNTSMYWGVSNIRTFHSIVPVSVMNFYDSIGVQRDVASRPDHERYGIRGLTSVKYLLEGNVTDQEQQPAVVGFERIGQQNGFSVSENQHYIPMGFTYDTMLDQKTFEQYDEKKRDLLMLRTLVLSDQDVRQSLAGLPLLEQQDDGSFSEQQYFADCANRAKSAGSEFAYGTSGFTSRIVLEKQNFVFYSVPYEEGWSAMVNGEPAEIVKANVGFMAVIAPKGDNLIEFRYQTPGLQTGLLLTFIGLLLYLLYMVFVRFLSKKDPGNYGVEPYYHRKFSGLDDLSHGQNELPKKQNELLTPTAQQYNQVPSLNTERDDKDETIDGKHPFD